MSDWTKYQDTKNLFKSEPFHPELPTQKFKDILGFTFLLHDFRIIYDYAGDYGKKDFAVMLIEDDEGKKFTTGSSGDQVVKRLKELKERNKLPTIIHPALAGKESRPYYII